MNYIHSFLSDLSAQFDIITSRILHQAPPEDGNPDSNKTPVLLIHGFMGIGSDWSVIQPELQKAGYRVFTIDLGVPVCSIDNYAKQVREKVEKIFQLAGKREINLIGHSMGGVVARQYRYKYAQNANVLKIITLASPLNGTKRAYLAPCIPAVREMLPNSKMLKFQREEARKDNITDHYHLGVKDDVVVLPYTSAYKGEAKKRHIFELQNVGHTALVFEKTVADWICTCLEK